MKLAFDVMDRKSVVALAEHYDPDIPNSENEVNVAKVRELATGWEKELNGQITAILEKV